MANNECCGNDAWRGHLCPYHEGYEDGHGDMEDRVEELEAALRTARDELKRWGWGDFHFTADQSQDRRVVDALAAIDRVLTAGKGSMT
jgi:hypothetical protein